MTRKEKEEEVQRLREHMTGAEALFLTDFRGLSVEQMNSLRADLRDKQINFKVIKNTLARLAAKDTDVAVLHDDMVQPRAAAWTNDVDCIPVMAKALIDFAKANPALELVSGVYDGKRIEQSQMEALSKLPTREELLAVLLAILKGPATAFVNVLAAVPRSFVTVLKAIEEKKPDSAD